ncbi:unnamed protein product [Blumeria hordei]|uniref:Endosomal spry domain-containing protein n=1 Tax=Blumeria hordei TaxID=2867405 RepID=A0A383V1Y2_BLUHO|nr:unnamed protein product [Blumeria hordei]
MAPTYEHHLHSYFSSLLKRSSGAAPHPVTTFHSRSLPNLVPRITPLHPGIGVTPPDTIPNRLIFIIFGLIGMSLVCIGCWFFFYAENGGFQFNETDWDDYKTSVLRRKGPNGTTLSGGTVITDLGGNSIVHNEKSSIWGRKNKKSKLYLNHDNMSSQTSLAGVTIVTEDMKEIARSKHEARKERKKKRRETSTSIGGKGDQYDDTTDSEHDDLAAYRHEKPARVGGLNKQSDASAFDSSANNSCIASTEHLSYREDTPPITVVESRKHNPKLRGGAIRKVISTSEGGHSTKSESTSRHRSRKLSTVPENKLQNDVKKTQDKRRAAQRRDFSFQAGDDRTVLSSTTHSSHRDERGHRRQRSRGTARESQLRTYTEESEVGSGVNSETGTKAYHHPIPELASSVGTNDYAEQRRNKRKNLGEAGA